MEKTPGLPGVFITAIRGRWRAARFLPAKSGGRPAALERVRLSRSLRGRACVAAIGLRRWGFGHLLRLGFTVSGHLLRLRLRSLRHRRRRRLLGLGLRRRRRCDASLCLCRLRGLRIERARDRCGQSIPCALGRFGRPRLVHRRGRCTHRRSGCAVVRARFARRVDVVTHVAWLCARDLGVVRV